MTEPITFEVRDSVGVLTLNRPAKLNAFNSAMAAGLRDRLKAVGNIRALVLTGAGRSFCAGWDLAESRDEAGRQMWEEGISRLAGLAVPTVAAIEGHCLGQGLLYALCCDMRVAGDGARIGFPEVKRGYFPGDGASQRIVRVIGRVRAKELMLLGNPIDVQTALNWGLLNRVAPSGEALAEALRLAGELAAGPPKALSVVKRLVDEGAELTLEEAIQLEIRLEQELDPAEAEEGVAAFFERRPPRFQTAEGTAST